MVIAISTAKKLAKAGKATIEREGVLAPVLCERVVSWNELPCTCDRCRETLLPGRRVVVRRLPAPDVKTRSLLAYRCLCCEEGTK